MKSITNKLFLPLWTAPLFFFALCAAAYGSLASEMGYFWDDWTIVWYIHFLGPSSFPAAFAFDRPLLAPIYMLTTSVLGEAPLSWQIFAIFTRGLACLALWWALRAVWSKHLVSITGVVLLFAVYPGFKQQYIAITYGNAFLVLALYLASWALMLWAVRKPHWFWQLYLISIFVSLYAIFTAEHFFGLEFLRPVLLWLAIKADIVHPAVEAGGGSNAPASIMDQQLLKRTGIIWLPYLLMDLLFLAWRITNKTPRAEITLFSDLKSNPLATLFNLGWAILQDIFKSSVLAWRQILDFAWLSGNPTSVVAKYAAISIGVFLMLAVFLLLLRNKQDVSSSLSNQTRRRWGLQAMGLGILSLLLAGIPIWPTNLRIELFFPWDRFTLPMMLGAALLLAGLFEWISVRAWVSILLVSLVASLAAGLHFHNALEFRKDWLLQRDFFWQLTWRAPALQPGTTLLTSEMPFTFEWDNSLTAPLNWTYAPELEVQPNGITQLPYLMYNAESRLSRGLPNLEKNTEINEYFRIIPFSGSMQQTILAFYRPPGSCVKVIDPQIDQFLPDKPRYFREIYPLSDPGLIFAGSDPLQKPSSNAQPPMQFFGPPPELDWCYYFEKAELARQYQDWDKIAVLGNEAFKEEKNFFRKNAHELLPFIEGCLHLGEWQRAYDLSLQAYHAWTNMNTSVCNLWESASGQYQFDETGQKIYQKVQGSIQCPN